MKYDKVFTKEFKDIATIEYGVKKGNNTVVFIKVGQDGSIYGYENKYLKIANNLNQKYGYTVIVASNPFDGTNPLDHDMNVVKNYCKEKNIKRYKVYYMGHSNGARIGLYWGYAQPKIKKMLLINSPLMMNLHNIKEGLKQCDNKEVYLIYGENDPSYVYTTLLDRILNDNIKLNIIPKADHHFTNMLKEYTDLPEKYFNV